MAEDHEVSIVELGRRLEERKMTNMTDHDREMVEKQASNLLGRMVSMNQTWFLGLKHKDMKKLADQCWKMGIAFVRSRPSEAKEE
jgi:hypothetical protein